MQRTAGQIVRTLEGVLALCLGSAESIVWVSQADAAAFSDGGKIYLPKPTGEHPQEYELLLALALREVAKIKHTDTVCFDHADGSVKPYAALIEDVRVKRLLGDEYLGSPQIFAQAFDVAGQVFLDKSQSGGLEAGVATHLALWGAANQALIGSDAARNLSHSLAVLAAVEVDAATLGDAVNLAAKGPVAVSTAEAVALGEQVLATIRKVEQEERQDQPQRGDQAAPAGGDQSHPQGEGGQQDGQQDQPQGGDQAAPAGGDQSQPQGEGDQQDWQKDQPQSDDQCPQAGGGPSQQKGEGADSEQTKAVLDILSTALAMLRGYENARPCSHDAKALADQMATPSAVTDSELVAIEAALNEPDDPLAALADAIDATQDVGEFNEEADDVIATLLAPSSQAGGGYADQSNDASNSLLGSIPGRLVSVMLREMQGRRRRPSRLGTSGKRVDVPSFWRLKQLGDLKVFRKTARVPGVSAAVSVLLDRSGSMEDQIGRATEVTYALALAMERINGVQVSVDVFPGTHSNIEPVLEFKQHVRSAKEILQTLRASGGTPTGSALQFRLPVLLRASVEKRFMFVITDGRPNASEYPLASQMIEMATESGVHLIGIGIGIEADVGSLFPCHLTVETADELPRALEVLFKSDIAERLSA